MKNHSAAPTAASGAEFGMLVTIANATVNSAKAKPASTSE